MRYKIKDKNIKRLKQYLNENVKPEDEAKRFFLEMKNKELKIWQH
jgi:hypothetical protein